MNRSAIFASLCLAALAHRTLGGDSAGVPAPATEALRAAPGLDAKTRMKAGPAGEAPVFDSLRAYRYLKEQCDLGPRNPGSEGHKRAIAYFEKHFRGLGIPVKLQRFVHTD